MTTDGRQRGFKARSVVNAVFIKMLGGSCDVGEMEGVVRREVTGDETPTRVPA